MWSGATKVIGALSLIISSASQPIAAQQINHSLPKGVTAAMVDQGKQLYEGPGICMACHGMDGKGTVGPDLTDSIWVHSKGSFEEIAAQIIKGVPESETKSGNIMPPRGGSALTDDEVRAVAAYVWTLSHGTKR
ncbi:MAG: cytochrome c [Gemmatimonadota bacterium]